VEVGLTGALGQPMIARRRINVAIDVKTLGLSDWDLVSKAAPGVFDDPILEGPTRAFLADPRHHLVVAVADGQVVGAVSAVDYVHPDKPAPELWINEVGVAPSHRRLGIGRRLMEHTIALARELGCQEAWVVTERSNVEAQRLYESAGGTPCPEPSVQYSFDLGLAS